MATPVAGEGARLASDRVKAVTWRGKLPDDQFDEFAVIARLPAASGLLYFTAVQTCDTVVEAWKERPGPGQTARDLRHPAPVLRVTSSVAASPAAVVASAVLPKEVKLVDGALVTASGASLYLFRHDTMVGMSHCEGECATAWPPLHAPKAAAPPKDWSKVERADGSLQWAFQDRPLYTTIRTGAALTEALGADGSWTPARLSAGK